MSTQNTQTQTPSEGGSFSGNPSLEEESLKKELEKRAMQYLTVNEAMIVLSELADRYDVESLLESRAEDLSKFYVLLKTGKFTVNVLIYTTEMYGYQITDAHIEVDISDPQYYRSHVRFVLPNGIKVADVAFEFDDKQLLYKDIREQIANYKMNALDIINKIADRIKEKQEEEKEEGEDEDE
jgi:hypothetical protein